MTTATRQLEELIQELTPQYQDEARDFVTFLLTKQQRSRQQQRLRQDWAEAITSDYSSIELQHLALEWRSE